jgi:hypothetical protein
MKSACCSTLYFCLASTAAWSLPGFPGPDSSICCLIRVVKTGAASHKRNLVHSKIFVSYVRCLRPSTRSLGVRNKWRAREVLRQLGTHPWKPIMWFCAVEKRRQNTKQAFTCIAAA